MIFDTAVYLLAALAVFTGFNSGLLRSIATILGYVVAAPVALGVAPALSFFLATRFDMPPGYSGVVLAGLLLGAGMLAGALLRRAISDVTGPQVSIPDRLAGATMGAARIALVAVLLVLIFDRIIPANREPGFLAGSQLRPHLSAAGQAGLRSLPPELTDYIDQLKRAHGI